MTIQQEIQKLKQEQDAVILTHYYVEPEIQDIADYIGDSYYLSKLAVELPQQTIVFCGVSFMGESAKLLNPEKRILMPDNNADCPMAHMATKESIAALREQYEDLAVVCYINSTVGLKALSDVCVTSANAVKIIRNMKSRNIFFIPDGNLGRYVAQQVPEKNIILNDGACPIHANVQKEDVLRAKVAHPGVKLLAHPECNAEVLSLADFIGSTSEIIAYAGKSEDSAFLIGTEKGVLHKLQQQNPNKQFYMAAPMCCADMKLVTLEKVKMVLTTGCNAVSVEDTLAERAMLPLQRMLELSK